RSEPHRLRIGSLMRFVSLTASYASYSTSAGPSRIGYSIEVGRSTRIINGVQVTWKDSRLPFDDEAEEYRLNLRW
ncbi:MAG: hypothetical protein LGR52_03450, partial [Candidatus Thiosymbion ectosymbiont of Robbea hypermnestra]|nr:hypothetical protein [Candidatus Thiosymbion ectosymbiont of Robbea hypermnestra]